MSNSSSLPQPSVPSPQSFLVSAGPTREYFDTVRFISNGSSGKQGFAVAEVARDRGYTVTLVSGPVNGPDPDGVKVIRVTTAAQMLRACVSEFESCDVAVMTAAVCDYRPVQIVNHKLKKSDQPLSVALEPTEDICAALGRQKQNRFLVGFAMDDRDGLKKAEQKYLQKNCDLIVFNGPENIGDDVAEVRFYSREHGWSEPIRGTKHEIARHLLDRIAILSSQYAQE